MQRPDRKTDVNKPFENVSCQGRIQNFFQKVAPIFVTFSRVVFLANLNLSNLSTKNDSRGSGGMIPRKIFENLHRSTEMAILLLFEQSLKKGGHIFDP